jgi:hypothetical protein
VADNPESEYPGVLRQIGQARNVASYELYVLNKSAGLIERLTKPLTLEECRDVLNENEYSYCFTWEIQGPWCVNESYVVAGIRHDDDDYFYDEGTVKLDLFEATCLARGFLAQGVVN